MARKKKEAQSEPDKIVLEAQKRFERCQDVESEFRKRFVEDVKFANGDAENGWQWEDANSKTRKDAGRPCLTINKVRQHCLQIINDAKQNKPSVKTLPIDGKADIQIAKILDGIIRHIEYNSHAEIAYDTATEFAVQGGIGYWRIVTEYAHDGSFDQEIFIRRVKNPLTVYLDPDIQSGDGSDAKYGFVFEDLDKEEFEAMYPDADGGEIVFPGEGGGNAWLDKDRIRVAEYFRKTSRKDHLVAHPERGPVLLSSLSDDEQKEIQGKPIQSRAVEDPLIEWYKIAGHTVIEKREWPGRYIPIVRVVGEEIDIEGKVERKGHVRPLKDPQRMYNFMSSAQTEYIALQTKTPFVAPVEAIEGFETLWARANQENRPYLPYNSRDEAGNPIDRPQREQPPTGAQAYLTAMQTAQQELMMASGQYQENFGQQSNAEAGVAIQARQRQGDKATYHFIDNLARAIRFTGRVLVDLIPKVYDTKRVLRIVGEDGSEQFAQIDPSQPHPVADAQTGQLFQADPSAQPSLKEAAQLIYNPGIGRYDVTVEVGPSFETRRAEAFHALTQIMGQDQDLMKVAGDLLFKAADFPMAQDVAERIRRTIAPAVLGDGPSPQEQDMQQKMAHMGQMIEQLSQALQQAHQGREQQEVNIKAFDANTKRLTALGQPIDPQMVAHLATQTVLQMLQEGPPEGQQQIGQPAQAGFFTPNQSQGTAQ